MPLCLTRIVEKKCETPDNQAVGLDALSDIAVRSTNISVFAEGDSFVMPSEADLNDTSKKLIIRKKMRVTTQDGQPIYAYAIPVEVTDKNGNKSVKSFYPTSLGKSVMRYDDVNRISTDWVSTKGTAADLAQQYDNIKDVLLALAGKTLKVTAVEQVKTWDFFRNRARKTGIMTIDCD